MPVVLRWLLRLGPTNPIAVRLVKNASRRDKHMYVRSAYLAVMILVLLWVLVVNASGSSLSYRELALAGSSSFVFVAYLQIGLICILAPVFMAGAISQEANPKSWDILLTTPLTQGEIVLGNLFGRVFFILGLLFASLPLFALTQYFGGVPGKSIFASYLVAACAALLVGTIAIALAVSRLAGRRAVFTFYVSVVSYIAATWAIDAYIRMTGGGAGSAGKGVTWMTGINPFLSLRALLSPASYPRADAGSHAGLSALFLESPVTAWCLGSFLLSLALMGASMITVRLGGLATAIRTPRAGVPWYRKAMGLGAEGAEHRPPRAVWANPIAWREAAARNATFWRILARWSFVAFGLLLGIVVIWFYHAGGGTPGGMTIDTFRFTLKSLVWTETAVITLVAINMAATAVSREREDGTLDLILTTPITPAMYLTGKLRGLVAYLLPMIAVPCGTLLLAGLYSMFNGLGRAGGANEYATYTPGGRMVYPFRGDIDAVGANTQVITIPAVLPEAGVLAGLVIIPFIAFCVMVGLNWSLKSKGTLGSVVGTVGVVGVIAGVIGLCAWQSASGIAAVGPALSTLSPASLLNGVIAPFEAFAETTQAGAAGARGLATARVALAIGAAITAAIYLGIVYGIHASMVRTFDFTVRKLAGMR
ncbi:MAG: ABC transporter permease subunit [Phycisphaerales bacterium]